MKSSYVTVSSGLVLGHAFYVIVNDFTTHVCSSRFIILLSIFSKGLPALVVAISVGFTKAKGYGTVN